MTLAVVEPYDTNANGAPWITDPDGQRIPSKETPMRTARILEGFRRSECCSFHRGPGIADDELTSILGACHSEDYLAHLRQCGEMASEGYLDERFCRPGSGPHTPLYPRVFDVAVGAVRTSLGAAHLLLSGVDAAYAACRPPGHHAGPNWSGGYCYLNNAMAAARYLSDAGIGAVAVLDFDFHFGDGSSAIAGAWNDLLFCSVNASARYEYPWMKTEPQEPNQLLVSLLEPPSEEEYLLIVDQILRECSNRRMGALVVSLGYDLIENDPHGGWSLTPRVFARLGEALARTGIPLCFVQEGGYADDRLCECSMQLARGVSGRGFDGDESEVEVRWGM